MTTNLEQPRPHFLSVVVPAYNESHRLPRTLDEIKPYLDRRFPRHEVLVVDDGSRDGTPELVEERAARDWPTLRVLRQPRNLGKGAAVRRGCLEARGELVLFMDADHATPIEEIERFVDDIERHGCGAVVGVRTYQENESRWRRIVGLSAQILAHVIVFRKAVVDSQCAFKLFTRQTVQQIFPLCRVNGGMIDVELFYLLHLYDVPCYYEPVHWDNKEGSRINMVRCMLFDPVDMVKIRLRHAAGISRRPVELKRQPWSVHELQQ
ncbi:MAG TPA: dolichyl-phosphate beta-glucosyltransferase [Chloroflexota bacterium]|jgi:dolichyl-phosphate beta-glucosyltransferase